MTEESLSSWSSDSPSGSLTSSSSSYDDGTRWSQAIIGRISRSLRSAWRHILVDLSLPDQAYQTAMGYRLLEVGFWYDGVFYPGEAVGLTDGAKPQLSISRQTPLVEEQLFDSWVNVMLGRLRGMLSEGRTDGQTVLGLDLTTYRIV